MEAAPPQRWAAGIDYLGGRYGGWQRQYHRASVQAEVEDALSSIAAQPITTIVAGRTDAGVHAFGQVVHFDSAASRTPYAWLLGTNARLPDDIGLRWIEPVSADFDARRSAVLRRYRYVIHNQRARSALLAGRAAPVHRPLDAEAMQRAAQALIGEHDFSAFRAAECQSKTPMRRLLAVTVQRHAAFVVADVAGNAFLHHMVRNIVGVLIEIGQGRRPENWSAEVLAGRDRTQGGITAPAEGLYFVGPEYPPRFGLPLPATPWFPV